MASSKPAYPFAGPNASNSNNNPFMAQPSPPAQLAHSPMNQQHQRRPFAAPPTPGGSPMSSTTSLLPPSARGPPGSPSPQRGGNLAPPGAMGHSLKHKSSDSSMSDAPAAPARRRRKQAKAPSIMSSISDQYGLGTDPSFWGADLLHNVPEADDHIHNPDPRRDIKNDKGGTIFTSRGIANLGCLFLLAAMLLTLFAGFPIITYFLEHPISTLGGYNLGGINETGQVPDMTGNWALIDKDTPQEVYTKTAYTDSTEMQLVFSDEFNVDGRTFYPGDDPFWEAVDLHYWFWYDPSQLTTKDGKLVVTLANEPDHGLQYKGGMMQTWNKFCFTGGLLEVSTMLPGANDVQGLWPAVWTMGNLGRAGFGASLDGMWPYSYNVCDVGTLPNQTNPDGTPAAAATGGYKGEALSYLPGQRLSACTCQGEIHPGPQNSDGSFKGRSAPEIDVFEAQVAATGVAHVSQSAQFAPYNAEYKWDNSSDNAIFYSPKFTLNTYRGGQYQMTTSGIGEVNQTCFELEGGCFSVYGFEYKTGVPDGFITWISEGAASWTAKVTGLGPDNLTEIGQRIIPEEPLYLIINLGMSENFGDVDLANLIFPTHMEIDWIRVYQPKDAINVGCDPDGYPTTPYIDMYNEAYTNANLTTWEQYGQTFPRNKLVDGCT
ncbi:hypothetical protein FRC04_007250 [Tulasnella sp. 424]|nr:hypothetical protein FRC04_007250 [Tulasnella sp. 424]KAG8976181.1 hypothetical protein FRC05_004430 [Tulasnella sp. 425]